VVTNNSNISLLNNSLPIFLILTFCGILFFYKLGALPLFDVDEPRYAETAREMLETRDWITPTFNDKIRYDKPIFFYWLIVISYKIFGVNEFAARFPSALLATLLVLFLFFLIRRFDSIRSALLSSLILSTSIQIIILSRASITDMALTFFISSSLFFFCLGYQGNEKLKKYFYSLFYASMGFATLTKGPVGIAIPLLVIAAFTLINGTFRSTLSKLMILQGLFILAIIILPWNLAMYKLHGDEFLQQFFIKHNIIRFVGIVSGHRGSLLYYIPVILIGFFPWIIFLPPAILKIAINIKKYSLKTDETLNIRLFAFAWFLVVFIFFTLSRTKLPTYITPLYPPMAILVGKLFDDILLKRKEIPRCINLSVFILILIFSLLSISIFFFPDFVNKFKSDSTSSFFNSTINMNYTPWLLSAILVSGIIFSSFSWFMKYKKLSLYFLLSTLFFFYLVCITQIGPEIAKYRQSSLKNLSVFARELLKKDDKLICYGFNKPSIVFYTRHHVQEINKKNKKRISQYLNSDSSVYVITKKSFLDYLPDTTKYYVLRNDGDYTLISNRPGGNG